MKILAAVEPAIVSLVDLQANKVVNVSAVLTDNAYRE